MTTVTVASQIAVPVERLLVTSTGGDRVRVGFRDGPRRFICRR